MAKGAVRRSPDAGVATAVASIVQHQKFKRMLMFGLRSLSDFCIPPALLYKENSLDALERGAISVIGKAVETFIDDEDLVACAVKVLWGMSEGIKQEGESVGAQRLVSDGGVVAIVTVIKNGSTDGDVIEYAMSFVENMAASGSAIDGATLGPGLLQTLQKTKFPPKTGKRIMGALGLAASSEGGSPSLMQAGGIAVVLEYCMQTGAFDADSIVMAEGAFEVCYKMAQNNCVDASALDQCIALMEKYKNKKSVSAKGSAALSVLVGPEQLQKCLRTLKTSAPDAPAREQALTMLSSMSYISTYTDDIVKAGGIPMLIDIINSGVNEISTNLKVYRMIAGAGNMLGRIASNPANVDLVASSGGVSCLCTALAYCVEDDDCIGALCNALVPLANREPLALDMVQYETYGTILPVLHAKVESKDVATPAMELVAASSQHKELHARLIERQAIEIVATCSQYHTDESVYQLNAVQALNRLSGNLSSVSTVYEFGGLAGISASLACNSTNEEVAIASVQLMETLANVPDAPTYMCDGATVDAILEAMLVQEGNDSLVKSGIGALDFIATETDCSRHLDELDRAIQGAPNDPDRVYKTLAAVAGLSRVGRLRLIIEDKNAAETVLKGISWWIEGSTFEYQGKVIQAAVRTAKTLKLNSSGDLTNFFVSMVNTACIPKVKKLVELQEPDNNVLIDMAKAAKDVAASGRIEESESVEQCVEAILKLMRKYPDSRGLQIYCLEILDYFAASGGGSGVQLLVKTGAITAVVSYLNRAPMYLNAQIAGFQVLATCVKIDPETADVIRKANGLAALTTASRTHSKSKELKRVIAPLAALLMPTDNLEREIREKLTNIEGAMDGMNIGHLHENIMALNDFLVAAEGSKIAARNRAAEIMAKVELFITTNKAQFNSYQPAEVSENEPVGAEFYNSCVSETANAVGQISSTRVGRVACTKADNTNTLINLYTGLGTRDPTSTTEEGVVRCLDGLRVLMKHDRNNADTAFQRGCVALLCKGIDKYPESESVLSSTCACLASMATTPSRVEQLIAQPDFTNLLEKLLAIVASNPNKDAKLRGIHALQDLLMTNDPAMVNRIAESGGVATFFKVLEEYPAEPDLAREAAKALALIGNFEDLRRFHDDDIRRPAEICKEALKHNRNVAAACEGLLDVMNKMATSGDRAALREAGCMEVVAEVMMTHSENDEIVRLGGELFSKMGADEQIRALMLQIINAVDQKNGDYIQTVDDLCVRLAMFLAAPIEDTNDALQYTENCLAALNACLAEAPSNVRLMGNIAMVGRRLCDRCFDDQEDAYGAWAITSAGQLDTFAGMIIDPGHKAGQTKKFVTAGYRVLAATCNNGYSKPSIIGLCQTTNLLPRTSELLELHKNDTEVVARILEFLRFLADDPEGIGAALVMQMNGSMGDIVQTTIALMNLHKKSDPVVIAGMGLLGALAANAGPEAHPAFVSGTVLKDCERLMAGAPADTRELAMMGLVEKFLASGYYNDALKKEKELDRIIGRLKMEEDEKRFTDAQRAGLYAGLGRMLMGSGGVVADVERAKGFDALVRGIEEFPEVAEVIKSINRALGVLAQADSNMAARCTHEAIPKLAMDASVVIQTDPECADTFCDLLLSVLSHEGNGRVLAQTTGVDETLQGIEQLGDYYGDEYGQALKDKVAAIRQAMVDDQPRDPTCQEVYELLYGRKAAEQSNSVSDTPLLLEKLEFLFNQMGMYGQERLDCNTAMGVDHQYGNMAFQLLVQEVDNFDPMIAKDFVKLCLSVFKNQKDEEIVQYSVLALSDFCRNPRGAQHAAKVAPTTTLTVEVVSNLQKDKKYGNEDRETRLNDRVQLIERCAINRNLYNKTKVILVLIALWDDYDKGLYSTTLLRNVFRAMRRVVSDAHVDELLRANVLTRLTEIVEKPTPDLALLPDVLFLLGSLAVVPEIKTKIGEIKGIEACINLLRVILNDPDGTPTITNCCLALANICIGHKKNIAIFARLKGQDLNVEVLNVRGNEFDVANAASVLLCNLLYKNEDMKKVFGGNGAPQALVYALQQYDGSDQKNALRCLQSLFKAISNLSLYTPNIQVFLDASIENSYNVLLQNISVSFPDNILETTMRTLSNLVMENEEFYMKKFGILLPHLLEIAKQGRTNTKVLVLLLDVLANLCRLPETAQAFADLEGINLGIKLIHQFNYDVALLTSGTHLLGIQSTIPSSIPKLVEADIFSILVGCTGIDVEGVDMSELIIGSLRCTRRIIQSEELAIEYASAGGIQSLEGLIAKTTYQSSVALEAYRLLLCALAMAVPRQTDQGEKKPPPLKTKVDDEDADIPDEQPDWTGDVTYSGLPAYQKLGMSEQMINSIIQAVCTTLLREGHGKQLRLQRNGMGLCAYFASQKVSTEMLIQSNFHNVMLNGLEAFQGDVKITLTSCIAINNVAKTSGDLYETIKTKELIAAVKNALSKIPSKDATHKASRSLCTATLTALNSNEDPYDVFENTEQSYNIELSEYNVDPYPNGVQDLPVETKATLRKGGRFKIVIGDKEREQILWRASQDLHVFEWLIGQEKEYSNRVPVVRLRNIAKGLSNETLKNANKKDSRKVTAALCMCVYGPAGEDYPDGLELSMKGKTKKERDQFVELLSTWRDAASYTY